MICKKCSAQVAQGSIICPNCLKPLVMSAKRRAAVAAAVTAGVILLLAAVLIIVL